MLERIPARRARRPSLVVAAGLSLCLAACGGAAPIQPTPAPTTPAPPTGSPPASPVGPTPTARTAPPGETASTAETPPVGSPPAGATPTPAASPAGTPSGEAGWQYLPDFPAGAAFEVSGVTAHGDGFVAVGFEPYPTEGFGGRRNGVVWTSSDGQTWQRQVPAPLNSVTPRAVVSLDGLLFAAGRYSICPELAEEECADAPDAGVALWRSPDGAAWERLPVPDSLRTGILDGLASDGDQLIAYGSTGEELVGALWLSPDGQAWNELREMSAVDPISTLEAGDGRLVAFGTRYLPDEDDVETLAGYSDGAGFAPAQLPAGQRGVMQDVAWSGTQFVAVGTEYEPVGQGLTAIALASADGTSWTAAAADDLPADAGFQQVVALPTGFLAVGSLPAGDEFGRELGRAWFSTDGLAWQEHGSLDGADYRQLTGAAHGPAGVVVFATDFEESDELEPVEPAGGGIHAWYLAPAGFP